MSSIGSALVAMLSTFRDDPSGHPTTFDIQAIVSDRIMAQKNTTGLYPCILFGVDSSSTGKTMEGNDGLSTGMISVFAVTLDYDSCVSLSRLISRALDSVSGTWDGVIIQGIWMEDSSEAEEADPESEDLRTYWVAGHKYSFAAVVP